jgi:hypothetical protein
MSILLKYIALALPWIMASSLLMLDPPGSIMVDNPGRELVHEVETDSIRYQLFLVRDEKEKPERFVAEIFTPVCYSNKCYPVFIDFYWDLLGNFQRFDMPPGKTLTKLDHIPFDAADYQKMQDILANTSSLLKDYQAEDLVVSTESDLPYGVDAVTGATSKTIANEVISGAVYSCYTLWHLAHGDLADLVKTHTENNYDDGLIISFLQSSNYHYQYWAIEKVLASKKWTEERFKAPLLNILRGSNVFVAEHVLETVPLKIWEDSDQQEWLWETYQKVSYRLQLKILDKFRSINLDTSLHLPLIAQLDRSNMEQKKRLFLVLEGQTNLSKEAQVALIPILSDDRWGKDAYTVLSAQNKLDKKVKKELEQFRTTTTI